MVRLRDSVLRCWRGECSLAVSFWGVGVLGLLLVLVSLTLYTVVASKADFHPYQALAVVTPVWVIAGAFAVYQLIGTWRSAVRFLETSKQRRNSAVLGWAAQTISVGGVAAFLALLWQFGVPHFQESVGIAFHNDPDVPGYSLRLMRDATEVEIAGGFKYGVARDVEVLLAANPRIRIIHLNSSGGRLGEGQKLAALIQARGLITYTASECASACTVAFAAGRERWLKKGATLGYHSASFGGSDSPGTMRDALTGIGINHDFATRAARISSQSLWYPRVDELVSNKIVSGSVDAHKFAASGLGAPENLDEGIRDRLLELSIFRAVDDVSPEVLEQAVADARRMYLGGEASEGVLLDTVRRTHLIPFLKARLAMADEQKLADFAELLADELDALGHADANKCMEYLVHGASEEIYDDLPYAMTERHDDLLRETLRMSERTSASLRLHRNTKPLRLTNCDGATSMMRDVSKLPPPEAASIVRGVLFKMYGH